MVDYTPQLRKRLRAAGFEFYREARGDHEIWRHAAKQVQVTVDGKTRSRHMANEILKQAGLPKAF